MRMSSLRTSLLLVPCVMLAAAAALAAPATASAHGAVFTASGTGTMSGTVLNGSRNNAPVAGQTVTLEVYTSHTQTQSAGTATTDAQGHFSFAGLDTSGSSVYQLDVRYDNGDFTTAPLSFDSGAVQPQTITVYDTTTDPSALSVTNTTMLFSSPDTKMGLIPVGVFVTFKNSSHLAFAPPSAPASGGNPMSLLRFALPSGAQDLTLGAGFTGVQVVQVDKGFAALATVPPGTTQFAYAYRLPYTSSEDSFQFKAVYPTAAVTLLVPTDTFVDDGDYAAKPPVQALGQQYQLLEADNVQAGEVLKMRLWNLPVPGEQPDFDLRMLQIFGTALALLLALLVALYLKRGSLAVALRLVPASALAKPERTRGGQEREAERKRLLKLLLALEKQHGSGQLGDAEYQRRRDNMRRKLKALLAESIATTPATASTRREIEPAASEAAPHAASVEPKQEAEEPDRAVADDAAAQPARPEPSTERARPSRRRAPVGGRR